MFEFSFTSRSTPTGTDMDSKEVVTTEFFTRRLADLCLRSGMSGLPKDALSQHVLFTSMVSSLPLDTPLHEREINETLARWIEASGIKELDHITLRRRLVDAGYLDRHADGTAYRVVSEPPGRPPLEQGAAALDLEVVLEARRAEIARRKAEYLAKGR
jgi:hypothetical protein